MSCLFKEGSQTSVCIASKFWAALQYSFFVWKVLIPLKSEPDGPGLRFGSDTRAHCLNTGQLSSRCRFLNRVVVRRHIAASQPCFKAKLGYCKIQTAALLGDGMAGAGGCAGPAPVTRWSHVKIFNFLFCGKGLIPHLPTQIRRRARGPGPTVREWHAWPQWLLELEHWPTWTLQPLPISQLGGCTSPHSSSPAMLWCQARLPRNPNGGPARRQHGWSGWRRRACARRSSPATRWTLFKRLLDLYHLRYR